MSDLLAVAVGIVALICLGMAIYTDPMILVVLAILAVLIAVIFVLLVFAKIILNLIFG
jgi:hypothetical protein